MTGAPIVVGIDGSDHSRTVLIWAITEARQRRARVHVVIGQRGHAELRASGAGPVFHRMDAIDLEVLRDTAVTILDEIRLNGGADPRGLSIGVEAHAGSPSEHLTELSAHAQLLVVGFRHGHDAHRFGTPVAAGLIRRAKCPVVVVP